MPRIDAALMDVPAAETIEDEVTSPAYFADQEPIDGGITVVDLTPSTCRWPSGNSRDLATFRYCGETAQGGPYCERHARRAYLQKAA
jgi:GcrA cell cycle regulator